MPVRCATPGRMRNLPVSAFLPIQLSEHAWPLDPRLGGVALQKLTSGTSRGARRTFVVRRIVVELAVLANLEAVAESQFEAPITVFVSHAKADIEREPKVTKRLIESLRRDQPIEAWVDSGDITAGSKFDEAIEHGVKGLRSLSLRTLTPHANGAAKKFCSPRSTSALW